MMNHRGSALGRMVLLTLLSACVSSPAYADEAVQMLSPVPAGAHSCVAAPLRVPSGELLTGVKWLHNDSSESFPRLLIVEGLPGVAPDLSETGVILLDLAAESLSWGQVDFPSPVTSSTGFAYAVFVYPAASSLETIGEAGGAGLGVVESTSGDRAHMSFDGMTWITLNERVQVQVEPLTEPQLQRATLGTVSTIAELAESISYALPSGEGQPTPQIRRTGLLSMHPNPFNPRVAISFATSGVTRVNVRLFDARGRLVHELVDGRYDVGEHEVVWDGQDGRGAHVASGVYFVRFEAGGVVETRRVALVR